MRCFEQNFQNKFSCLATDREKFFWKFWQRSLFWAKMTYDDSLCKLPKSRLAKICVNGLMAKQELHNLALCLATRQGLRFLNIIFPLFFYDILISLCDKGLEASSLT